MRKLQDKDGHAIQIVSETPHLVEFHTLGGGFIQCDTPLRVFRRYNVEYKPVWRRIYVSADWMGHTLKAWGNGRNWNGWAVPHFELEQALGLLTLIDELSYQPERDCFVHVESAEETMTYPGFIINVDGVDVKVYQLGDGWCWDSMAPPTATGETK